MRHPHYRFNHFTHENSNNPPCSSETISGRCTYCITGPSLSGGGPFIFTDTDFIECKVTEGECFGGAIDCTSGHLTIKRCSFKQCHSNYRAGAVSFRSNGMCVQEDNCYLSCSSGFRTGAFDSWDTHKYPSHDHKRCKYMDNSAQNTYPHSCLEYSSSIKIDSNIYIHGKSSREDRACTVVNYHSKNAVVYANCLFSNQDAINTGGLSFMSSFADWIASYSVKFCFFSNSFNADSPTYEIYFDTKSSSYAKQELIVHCFSLTPNSKVFLQNQSPQEENWLPP